MVNLWPFFLVYKTTGEAKERSEDFLLLCSPVFHLRLRPVLLIAANLWELVRAEGGPAWLFFWHGISLFILVATAWGKSIPCQKKVGWPPGGAEVYFSFLKIDGLITASKHIFYQEKQWSRSAIKSLKRKMNDYCRPGPLLSTPMISFSFLRLFSF